MMKGKAFKFGDNISTDHIVPGRLLHLRSNLPELAKHVLEDADPTFAQRVKKGDFVVGGKKLRTWFKPGTCPAGHQDVRGKCHSG